MTSSSASGNQWYLNGNPIGGATNQAYIATASGDYTVTDMANGCTSTPSSAAAVIVNALPATPTITPGGPTTFCQGGSVTLTSSSATGNQWYLNGNPIGGASDQTDSATASGNYTVVVTDGNNCLSAPSAATLVTVNPIPATPTITPGGPTTFCQGGSVTLTSSSATGVQWFLNGNPIGGATDQAYIATASGNYTNTVSDLGCTSAPSAATTVTVNPIPATPTITPGGDATLCPGGDVTLTSSSANGNQWYLNGNPIGGATSQTYIATAGGSYTVIVSSSGCSSAASAATTVTPNVAPRLTYSTPQYVAFAGTLNVIPTSASSADYVVQSVVPALTTAPTVNSSGVVSITNSQPTGSHTITIRATDGCAVTTDASFTLNVTLITTYADPSGNCSGDVPCFTTIQAAIDALTGPGTVNVSGGIYDENVNVSTNATVNINGDTTINSLTMSGGTLNGSNGGSFTLTLAVGDWTNESGTFNAGTGTVSFIGTGQAIGGTNATVFNNLTIGAGGTILTVDQTVAGVLTLNGDLTVTDPAKLIMLASAGSAGMGDVIGNLERLGFVTGDCPVTPCSNTLSVGNPSNQITITGGVAPASILVNLVKSAPATYAAAVQRNYPITEAGGSDIHVTGYRFTPEGRSFSQLGNNTKAVFTATPEAIVFGNAIDTPEFFVRQHYLDFLGREPDESGFNFWSDQLLSCGSDAACVERRTINVSAAYFLSIEFQETGGLVDGLYRASYGRRPQYAEFMPDMKTVRKGVVVGVLDWAEQLAVNKQALVEAWVQRAEFQAAYQSLNNEAYVNALIGHTEVVFSQSEGDALVNGLNKGTSTRAEVLRQIAENDNFVAAKRNAAFVMMQYFGYLRRDPDEAGYAFWLNKLNQFDGNFERAEMVKAFLVSAEYRQRFRF